MPPDTATTSTPPIANPLAPTPAPTQEIVSAKEQYSLANKWGSFGTADGQFLGPFGVAVDSSGNVYIGDCENDRIQIFDSDGNFITKWGSEGSGYTGYILPYGIAVDSSDNVYVSVSVQSHNISVLVLLHLHRYVVDEWFQDNMCL